MRVFDQFTRQILYQLHPSPVPLYSRIIPAPLFDINSFASFMIQEKASAELIQIDVATNKRRGLRCQFPNRVIQLLAEVDSQPHG
jgi:hypothetical protein